MTILFERTKLSDEDLRRTFNSLRAEYGNDFALMFTALHLETMERLSQFELRLGKLEARKR